MKKSVLLIILSTLISNYLLGQKKIDSTQIINEVKISAIVGNEVGAFNLPASAQYIGDKELQEQKYSDVHRILKQVPGVHVQEEDGFGLRPNIGMRGTSSERSSKITIMEDGILMAPAAYSAPSAYYFPTAARMSGVEVIKGSGQIRFGPNTTGGVLNFISSPITNELSARVTMAAGSFGTRNMLAQASGSYKQLGFLVQSYQAQSNGFKTLPSDDYTGFNVQDYLLKLSYSSKARARFFQRIELKLAENTQRSNETYLGITAQDFAQNPYQRYEATRFDNINLKQHQYVLQHQIYLNPNTSIQTAIYRTDFSRNWYKTENVTDSLGERISIASLFNNHRNDFVSILKGQTNGYLDIKANNRIYYNQGVQTSYQTQFYRGAWKHQVVIGARLHQDAMDRFQWIDKYQMFNGLLSVAERGNKGTESNSIQKASALATYMQYELHYKKWRFIPGLRYENIQFSKQDYGKTDTERTGDELAKTTNKNQVLLPGLGMAYAWNKHLNLILGAHRGYSPSGVTAEAKPELSANIEMGGKYLKNNTSVSLIAFYSYYDNLLGADNLSAGGLGSGDLFNGGQSRAYGLELAAAYDIMQANDKYHVPIGLNYTFTQAQFLNSFNSDFDGWGQVQQYDFLPYLPQQQLGLNVGFENRKFSCFFNYKYQSSMFSVAGNSSLANELVIPAFAVSDIALNYNLSKRVQFFGNVLNVFNKQYLAAMRPAGMRPGMPRAFRVGVQVSL